MGELEPWWHTFEPMAKAGPRNGLELVAVLRELAGLAGQWSDVLEGLRDATRQFGGPGAAAAFEVACRRSEQAFVELEIALRDARDSTDAGF